MWGFSRRTGQAIAGAAVSQIEVDDGDVVVLLGARPACAGRVADFGLPDRVEEPLRAGRGEEAEQVLTTLQENAVVAAAGAGHDAEVIIDVAVIAVAAAGRDRIWPNATFWPDSMPHA